MHIELGEGQQLTLPKHPRKRQVTTFGQWSKCFAVYAATLCAHHPTCGPDMMAYRYVMASAQQEFPFAACLAYDVAFRKKAARYRLTSWGPQLYSKAFTGAHRGPDPAVCTLCLKPTHPSHECDLYPSGPAEKPRTTAGPQNRSLPPEAQRSGATTTAASARGRTAHGHTAVPTTGALGHTPLPHVRSGGAPHRSDDLLPPPHPFTVCNPTLHPRDSPFLPPLDLPDPRIHSPVHVRRLASLLMQHPNRTFV